MGGSGLIYAAIALMWAVVLIPMWLRNHDTAAENRSAERFGQAMRVLSRKEHAESEENAEMSPEEPEAASLPARERPAPPAERAATTTDVRPTSRGTDRPAPRRSSRQRPQRTLAQRRARTLGALAGLSILLMLVAAVTPVPWWAPLPVVTVLGAFVVHLRIQARQQQQRRSGPARPAAERYRGPAVPPEHERSTSGFVSGPSRALVVETKGARTSTGAAAGDVAQTSGQGTSEGDETWRPNELPLPTYVTAPKAIRPIKVIDLTSPGAWSSGRLLDDGLSEEDLLAAQVADAELDALLEQEAAPSPPVTDEHDEAKRRAVGD